MYLNQRCIKRLESLISYHHQFFSLPCENSLLQITLGLHIYSTFTSIRRTPFHTVQRRLFGGKTTVDSEKSCVKPLVTDELMFYWLSSTHYFYIYGPKVGVYKVKSSRLHPIPLQIMTLREDLQPYMLLQTPHEYSVGSCWTIRFRQLIQDVYYTERPINCSVSVQCPTTPIVFST